MNILVRFNPRSERFKSLCGSVALLKHFQSWDHRCHRCRDAWGIFVSLILSHPVFFFACYLICAVILKSCLTIYESIILSNKHRTHLQQEHGGIFYNVANSKTVATASNTSCFCCHSTDIKWTLSLIITQTVITLHLGNAAASINMSVFKISLEKNRSLSRWWRPGAADGDFAVWFGFWAAVLKPSPLGPQTNQVFSPLMQKTAFTKVGCIAALEDWV